MTLHTETKFSDLFTDWTAFTLASDGSLISLAFCVQWACVVNITLVTCGCALYRSSETRISGHNGQLDPTVLCNAYTLLLDS